MTGSIVPYPIEGPSIPTGQLYLFTTDSGIRYEVRFGWKQDNPLHATIVFGVLNEEYEGEEYVITNRGDLYRVMATIASIVRRYVELHPDIKTFEFCGEPDRPQADTEPTIRTRLYMRYIRSTFGENWRVDVAGNKVTISRNDHSSFAN